MSLGPFILGAAGIQGATSLAGGKKGASAATQAAQIQAQAAMQSLAFQKSVYEKNTANLQPFLDYGTGGIPGLTDYLTNVASKPIDTSLPQFTFQPTQAQLDALPGYQYQKSAALDAEQARLAAMGLGRSSASARGAAQTASGLAGANWQSFYDQQRSQYQTNINSLLAGRTMDLQQRQQIINMLNQRVDVGRAAGANIAGVAASAVPGISSAITGAGAAQASGLVGAANALTGGLQGVGNAAGNALGGFQTLALTQALQNQGQGFNYAGGGMTNSQFDAWARNPANWVS